MVLISRGRVQRYDSPIRSHGRVYELPLAAAVGVHDPSFPSALMRGKENDAAGVGQPGGVYVVLGVVGRQALAIRSIYVDCTDVPGIPCLAGESDFASIRRPGWYGIVGCSGQSGLATAVNVNEE
jgi:hypothetical protein